VANEHATAWTPSLTGFRNRSLGKTRYAVGGSASYGDAADGLQVISSKEPASARWRPQLSTSLAPHLSCQLPYRCSTIQSIDRIAPACYLRRRLSNRHYDNDQFVWKLLVTSPIGPAKWRSGAPDAARLKPLPIDVIAKAIVMEIQSAAEYLKQQQDIHL